MKKLSRKEKLNLLKAGVGSYVVSSLVAWLKEGGFRFINQQEAYVIKFHKSLGVIDVFRLKGFLSDKLDLFGSTDWFFVVIGMGSVFMALGVMRALDWVNKEDSPEHKMENTTKGMKVKIKRPKVISSYSDFEL